MNKSTKDTNNETPTSTFSKKLTTEESCKKYGIPYRNETEKYVGQSSVYVSTQPKQSSEKPDSGSPTSDDLSPQSNLKLPPPPERKNFATQVEFEEALGYWQTRIGRIQGIVSRARKSRSKSEADSSSTSPDSAQSKK